MESKLNFANKSGIVLNAIFSIMFIIFGIILLILIQNDTTVLFVSIFFIVGGLITTITTFTFWINHDNSSQIISGIMGLFFGVVIGGILIMQGTKIFGK